MLTGPNLLLRLEGLALFVAAVGAYIALRADGWLFALLLFAPDLAMLGYAVNPRVGALVYNVGHHLILPLVGLAIGAALQQPTIMALALIWVAHIGMDRVFGYGFKYATAFKDTHLGRV